MDVHHDAHHALPWRSLHGALALQSCGARMIISIHWCGTSLNDRFERPVRKNGIYKYYFESMKATKKTLRYISLVSLSLSLYIYIYIYICIFTFMSYHIIYTYIYIYIYIDVILYIYMYIYIYI